MQNKPASSDEWDDDALAHSRHAWEQAFEALQARYGQLWSHAGRRRDGVRLLFLVGDSIVRGANGKSFDLDPRSRSSALQHIDRLINMMAARHSLRALYTGVVGNVHLARLLRGVAVPGDFVLFQDWGWRPRTYPATFHNFASVGSLVADFDGIGGIFLNTYASTRAPEYRFDLPCSDGSGTPNDAIAAAADECHFRLIDVHAEMGRFDVLCQSRLGLGIMQSDGVHPNPLGNLFLACIVLREVLGEPPDPTEVLALLEGAAGARRDEVMACLRESTLAA